MHFNAPEVDTNDPRAVRGFVNAKFESLFPGARWLWFDRLFEDICEIFVSGNTDYQRVDSRYHDLKHTLQAVVCLMLIVEGRGAAGSVPKMNARDVEHALCAALLHDSGYFRLRGDSTGTAAKYTYCHVIRSCAFAASYFPRLGATIEDVRVVINAIDQTGPAIEIGKPRGDDGVGTLIGSLLGTADFIGQMAASDYLDKLVHLYEEFEESDEYCQIPNDRRSYSSAAQLRERTPSFWHFYVKPKLNNHFGGMYKFLARPCPDGCNMYLKGIEKNLALIEKACARETYAGEDGIVAKI